LLQSFAIVLDGRLVAAKDSEIRNLLGIRTGEQRDVGLLSRGVDLDGRLREEVSIDGWGGEWSPRPAGSFKKFFGRHCEEGSQGARAAAGSELDAALLAFGQRHGG